MAMRLGGGIVCPKLFPLKRAKLTDDIISREDPQPPSWISQCLQNHWKQAKLVQNLSNQENKLKI